LGRIQPSQQTFENRLGIALLLNSVKNPGGQLLVEDESTYIGGVTVPGVFRKQMRSSQVVLLEVSLDERAEWIRKLYVEAPISSGVTEFALKSHFSEALLRIRSKLGGLRHDQIRRQIGEAKSPDEHRDWIRSLLEEYYDPLYRYSLEKDARAVIFRGNREEVREWLKIHDQAH
jgi:tRNA 2-selenouridine synthase